MLGIDEESVSKDVTEVADVVIEMPEETTIEEGEE